MGVGKGAGGNFVKQAGPRHCRIACARYLARMTKRTSPQDAARIDTADDLSDLVQDKREGWRATDAKARRRQRRYQNLLTHQLLRIGTQTDDAGEAP
jgi:hypothetical protein